MSEGPATKTLSAGVRVGSWAASATAGGENWWLVLLMAVTLHSVKQLTS